MSDNGMRPDPATVRKAALRARVLAARRALPAEVRATAAHRVQAVLRSVLVSAGAGTATAGAGGGAVAGYVPIGTEPGGPDLPAALAAGLAPGGRLLLPALCPDLSLDWVVYHPATVSGAARPGTDPPGRRLGPAALGSARLVVVPALAVDRRGVRLGRGGGSYDRALVHAAPQAQVVALLYDGELLDAELPLEPHDRRVTAVIMPSPGLVPLPP
jgi:5-formyltetrahydrofolate cyclo-ligase